MLYPLPVPLITCGDMDNEYNIITIAWTGIISTDPPRCYISVRPQRYSHRLLIQNREFVINLSTKKLAFAADWCGVKSGKDVDKFREMGLTPVRASEVSPPMIAESPLNLECRVYEILKSGSHDMFLADIVKIHASKSYINEKNGAFNFSRADPICYSHGKYYSADKFIGNFGFSVRTKKKKKGKIK